MTRLVEINAESLAGVQRDVRATRDSLQGKVGPLRRRAAELGVATAGFDDLLDLAHRLDTAVLPVVDVSLRRAQDLAAARCPGFPGTTLPVVDAPWTAVTGSAHADSAAGARFTLAQAQDGATVVSWAEGSPAEHEQERTATSRARSLAHWLGEEVSGAYADVEQGAQRLTSTARSAWRSAAAVPAALAEGAHEAAQRVAHVAGVVHDRLEEAHDRVEVRVEDEVDAARERLQDEAGRARTWVHDTVRQAWDTAAREAGRLEHAGTAAWHGVVDATLGAAHAAEAAVAEGAGDVHRWWEDTTADAGAWIDEHGSGVREWIGEHVAAVRWVAKALRITGWVVVAVGVVLTVVLAVEGALGGGLVGGIFGAGVGAAPGGVAGAIAGAKTGLTVIGVGFSLVSLGDLVDSLADWGEGDVDGQQLVESATWNLAVAAGSFVGIGIVGKSLEKLAGHLPPSVVTRIDDLLGDRLAGLGFGRPRRIPPLDEAARDAPLRPGATPENGWTPLRNKVEKPYPESYGRPQPDAPDAMDPDARPPADLNPSQRDLPGSRRALDHPWGTDPATGKPFTEQEFTDRFIGEEGWPRFPLNDGAVPYTKIAFSDVKDFTAIYGNHLDRIGERGGQYLGVPPGQSFDSRALPPDTLGSTLHEYVFSGELPEDWAIEVSKVAPGFGRAGGGTQVRVLDDRGAAVSVRKLVDEGVLVR